jgi:hypothetical protein
LLGAPCWTGMDVVVVVVLVVVLIELLTVFAASPEGP